MISVLISYELFISVRKCLYYFSTELRRTYYSEINSIRSKKKIPGKRAIFVKHCIYKLTSRFQPAYILSQPSPKWKGFKGHITSEILQDAFANLIGDSCYTRKDVYVLVCGPTVFTNLAQSLLKELEVSDEQMYLFLG